MNTQNTTQNLEFINSAKVRVSADKNYLLIFLPENKIVRKHVNYFKAILANITSEVNSETIPEREEA